MQIVMYCGLVILRVFLTPKDGKSVAYQPGDSIALYPRNNETDVNWVLDRLSRQIEPDEVVILKRKSEVKKTHLRGFPVDHKITPRVLVRDFIELHSLASRKTTKLLADCCQNENEKTLLLKLCSKDGTQLYNE